MIEGAATAGRRARLPTARFRPRPPSFAAAFLLLLCLNLSAPPRANAAASLPYAALLGRAYDAVLDARFDEVEADLQEACGPAPPETCDLLRATATWWRIQFDPRDRSLDPQFKTQIDGVIEATTRWTERQPRRADSWFFLGAALGVRVQFRVLRGERLSAARDGKRIKDALEKALSLDPTLDDAYFGIGLYHYYADLAPAALKLLRWMLALPGGDRTRGLREMLQAADRGDLLRGETDYQLHLVYLWYEHQPEEALARLDRLRARYPHNPLFVQAAADAQDVYLHDHAASLDTWRTMFNLARQGRLAMPAMSEARARLGIADQLDAMYETDYAVEQLRILVAGRPAAPHGLLAAAALKLGECEDRLGRRDEAVAAYKAAMAAAPAEDRDGVRATARDRLRRAPDARAAEAYRLSLDGWRALQREDYRRAEDALGRSLAIAPADPVARLRYGRLMLARGHASDALAAFEQVAAAREVPPSVLAAAHLEAGRLHERAGDRAAAIDHYRRASQVAGAEPGTRRAAAESLSRLRVPPAGAARPGRIGAATRRAARGRAAGADGRPSAQRAAGHGIARIPAGARAPKAEQCSAFQAGCGRGQEASAGSARTGWGQEDGASQVRGPCAAGRRRTARKSRESGGAADGDAAGDARARVGETASAAAGQFAPAPGTLRQTAGRRARAPEPHVGRV
jgi:tetratricopeptide (TPR) repeat protein